MRAGNRSVQASRRQAQKRHSFKAEGYHAAVVSVVCGCIAIAGGAFLFGKKEAITRFVNRPVASVQLDTTLQHVTDTEIRRLLSPYISTGFFDLDVKQVQLSLESHPWVHRASVQRRWPDTLVVDLAEQVIIARWNETRAINQFGDMVVPPRGLDTRRLPQLSGNDESLSTVMEQYRMLSNVLYPAGISLNSLAMSDRGGWTLTVNDEIGLKLGTKDLLVRLQRFVDFYTSQPLQITALIASADLRYANGIAVENATNDAGPETLPGQVELVGEPLLAGEGDVAR